MRGLIIVIAVTVGSLSVSNLPLFAQTPTPAVETPGGSVTGLPFHIDFNQLTATAVLAWYAWYTASRAIPDIITKHTEQMKATQDQFVNELGNARKAFQDQITSLQSAMHTDAMAVSDSIGELAKSLVVLQERIKG